MAGRPGRCTRRSIEDCRGALKSTTYNEDEDDDDEEENAHDDDALQTHDDAAARAPYKEDDEEDGGSDRRQPWFTWPVTRGRCASIAIHVYPCTRVRVHTRVVPVYYHWCTIAILQYTCTYTLLQ
jgi:hypothetical protein